MLHRVVNEARNGMITICPQSDATPAITASLLAHTSNLDLRNTKHECHLSSRGYWHRVKTEFEVSSEIFPGGTDENHDFTQTSHFPGQYLISTMAQLVQWLVYGIDDWEIVVLFISGRGKKLFSEVPRLASKSTQLPDQWTQGWSYLLLRRQAEHPPEPSADVKNAWIIFCTPPHAVVLI